MSELIDNANAETEKKMRECRARAREIINNSGVDLHDQLELSVFIFQLEERAFMRGKQVGKDAGRLEGYRMKEQEIRNAEAAKRRNAFEVA